MSIVSLAALKAYFQTGDFPTEQQFIDLIETLGQQNNLRTLEYTIGVPGATGVDYNFTSAADHNEQSIQLGSSAIIPGNCPVITLVAKCTEGLTGAATGTSDIGTTSGGTEYVNAGPIDDTDEIRRVATFGVSLISSSATSVYFSFDPDTNWNALTEGKWKVWITYLDNTLL